MRRYELIIVAFACLLWVIWPWWRECGPAPVVGVTTMLMYFLRVAFVGTGD